MLLAALLAPLVVASPPALTDKQVYSRMLKKLENVKTLTYEVHGYNEKGNYDTKYWTVSVDIKRGYRLDGKGYKRICDLTTKWSYYDGKAEATEADGFDISYCAGFEVFPNQYAGECYGDVAQKLKFDNRSCYAISPKYSESPISSTSIYVDATTFLPAGASESQMGEFGYLVAYRKVKLNPRLKSSLFVVPKK